MCDDFTADKGILPGDSGVWYPDEDHSIPYLTFRASRCRRTLSAAELTAWTRSPVVGL